MNDKVGRRFSVAASFDGRPHALEAVSRKDGLHVKKGAEMPNLLPEFRQRGVVYPVLDLVDYDQPSPGREEVDG